MDGLALAFCAVPDRECGLRLARTLVEEGLVACAQIIPRMTSVYRWQGQICEEDESLLLLKLPQQMQEQMMDRLRGLHPYQVPEIVLVTADTVLPAYLRWALGLEDSA